MTQNTFRISSQTHFYKPKENIFQKCLKNTWGFVMQSILLDLWHLLVWKESEVKRLEFSLGQYLLNSGLVM